MARKPRLGAKIRRLRRESELTQAQLAQRLMISASYLNLIEHNQRAVTVPLLFKLGEVLNVDLQTLSQDDESIILAELSEILGDPLFSQGDSGKENQSSDQGATSLNLYTGSSEGIPAFPRRWISQNNFKFLYHQVLQKDLHHPCF